MIMKHTSLVSITLLLLLTCTLLLDSGCGGRKEKTSTWTFDTSLEAWKTRDAAWKNYRQRFQGHFQMIGLQSFDDGSHLLIISEPPPHVSLEALNDSLSLFNHQLEVKTDTVGEDGWVKDVVVAVADAPLTEIRHLIRGLSTLFYGSDYHADIFLPLPAAPNRDYFLADNLNYQVTLPEIRKWFFDDGEPILGPGQTTKDLAALLDARATGVYFSQKPGFVIWIIERSGDLSKNKDDIRHFALDADLVLGAVANSSHVAVVGRERVNSILDLPPLRTETICMLAATGKSELAQSYERTMFLAGKLPNGEDWAPIYLSDELKNTEYGSLLNITDQMLKSWSCNGQIAYKRWKHPAPNRFAFKGNGLMDEIGDDGSVTFNWNTKGAAYSAQQGDFDIVALNRTGSLPVSYIPEGMEASATRSGIVRTAETRGYDYYSTLNNPDLVRVVQYGFLYQIFDKFDISSTGLITASAQNPPEKEKKVQRQSKRKRQENATLDHGTETNPLIEPYTKALNKIASLNEQGIETWSRQMVEALETQLDGRFEGEPLLPVIQHSSAMRDIARQVKSEGNLEDFVLALASPRDQQTEQPAVKAFLQHTLALAHYDYGAYLGVSFSDVFNACKSAWAKSESPWIKTPTVVLSWNTNKQVFGLGGHNLGAHVTPFSVDPTLPPGNFRVEQGRGGRTVFTSKEDIAKVNPAMVQATKDAEPGSWKFLPDFLRTWNTKTRPRESVVNTGERPRGIKIEKLTSNTFKVGDKECAGRAELEAAMTEEARKTNGKIEYRFEKFSDDEVMAALKTQQIKETGRLNAKGFTERITHETFNIESATVKSYPEQGVVVVEIPAKQGFWVKAKVSISRLARNMVSKAEAVAKKALGKCKNDPKKDFETEFFKEWKQEGFDKKRYQPLFRKEFFDVIIGQIIKPIPSSPPGEPIRNLETGLC